MEVVPERAEKFTGQLLPALVQAYACKDDTFSATVTAPISFASDGLSEVMEKVIQEQDETEDYKTRFQAQRQAFENDQPKTISQVEPKPEDYNFNKKTF